MRIFLNKFKNDQTFFLSCLITIAVLTQKIVSGETVSETDFAPLLVGASSPAVRAKKSQARATKKASFLDTDAEI